MINIHHCLEELSSESISSSSSTDFDRQEAVAGKGYNGDRDGRKSLLLFRSKRSLPGGGLYKAMDDVRPVLQIHDELLFEVRSRDVRKVAAVVKDCMENAVGLRVPLQVKLSTGDSWGRSGFYLLILIIKIQTA